MSYEPLHHKYRPQTFADLVGQEAIATTLINAIGQEKIAPAYLFSGPRGTGKTSSARILAKSLNCLSSDVPTATPCGKCQVCQEITKGATLDVIEIDAASNTGVDNIRELIEKAQFAPVQCRYKVYIIDEVHMLSNAAFNALLKTLEEPPDQVIFVLATTDPQRVLPTIISRCQRFDFRRIPLNSMVKHLRDIANRENININDEAITLVAQIAQGGLRDAESTLDQLSLLPDTVTVEKVWDLVGAVPEQDLMSLLLAIAKNEPIEVLEIARRLMDRGREPLIVIQNLASFYRDLLIAKTAPDRAELVAVTSSTWQNLCQFQGLTIPEILAGQKNLKESEYQLKNTTQPRLWLEVTLIGLLPISITANQPVKQNGLPARTIAVQQPEINRDRANPQPLPPPPPNSNHQSQIKDNSDLPAPQPERVETNRQDSPPATTNTSIPAKVENQPADRQQVYANYPTPDLESSRIESDLSASELDETSTQQLDLDEIWRKVLPYIQPKSIQQLLSQLCRLEDFTDRSATISIRTDPSSQKSWVENLQKRLPNIEAAFRESLNLQVKVILVRASSTTYKNTRVRKEETHAKSSKFNNSDRNITETVAAPPSTTIAPAQPKFESEKSTYTAVSNYPSEIKPSSPSPETPVLDRVIKPKKQEIKEPVKDPVKDDAESVSKAALRLVEMFQGEIISIADNLKISLPATKEKNTASNNAEITFADLGEDEIENDDF